MNFIEEIAFERKKGIETSTSLVRMAGWTMYNILIKRGYIFTGPWHYILYRVTYVQFECLLQQWRKCTYRIGRTSNCALRLLQIYSGVFSTLIHSKNFWELCLPWLFQIIKIDNFMYSVIWYIWYKEITWNCTSKIVYIKYVKGYLKSFSLEKVMIDR